MVEMRAFCIFLFLLGLAIINIIYTGRPPPCPRPRAPTILTIAPDTIIVNLYVIKTMLTDIFITTIVIINPIPLSLTRLIIQLSFPGTPTSGLSRSGEGLARGRDIP